MIGLEFEGLRNAPVQGSCVWCRGTGRVGRECRQRDVRCVSIKEKQKRKIKGWCQCQLRKSGSRGHRVDAAVTFCFCGLKYQRKIDHQSKQMSSGKEQENKHSLPLLHLPHKMFDDPHKYPTQQRTRKVRNPVH